MPAMFRSLPAASRVGAGLTLIGLAMDLVVHGVGGDAATGIPAAIGHLVTLVGMALAVSGVMWLGLRGSPGEPARERRG